MDENGARARLLQLAMRVPGRTPNELIRAGIMERYWVSAALEALEQTQKVFVLRRGAVRHLFPAAPDAEAGAAQVVALQDIDRVRLYLRLLEEPMDQANAIALEKAEHDCPPKTTARRLLELQQCDLLERAPVQDLRRVRLKAITPRLVAVGWLVAWWQGRLNGKPKAIDGDARRLLEYLKEVSPSERGAQNVPIPSEAMQIVLTSPRQRNGDESRP